ncbi:hypothetical protein [Paraliobacillus sp. X-1268]|uniref:hypothetical protein n=1 Tax=Paraliobacillus sp. X-1268 TaxID=2213193 RepID=UPI000E3DD8BC|nr:hypothetical protein [Paraliobacillus sp. X-1268]
MNIVATDQDMLSKFKDRFEEIKEVKDDYLKSIRLGALMTDMEYAFRIPLLGAERIAAYKRSFPEIMSLYLEASYARCF